MNHYWCVSLWTFERNLSCRIPWVLGYHSQGRSISVYADLDLADADELHGELCRVTRQGRDKFRVKSNLEYNWEGSES